MNMPLRQERSFSLWSWALTPSSPWLLFEACFQEWQRRNLYDLVEREYNSDGHKTLWLSLSSRLEFASQNMAKHFNNACQCIESFLGEVACLECCLTFGGQSWEDWYLLFRNALSVWNVDEFVSSLHCSLFHFPWLLMELASGDLKLQKKNWLQILNLTQEVQESTKSCRPHSLSGSNLQLVWSTKRVALFEHLVSNWNWKRQRTWAPFRPSVSRCVDCACRAEPCFTQ